MPLRFTRLGTAGTVLGLLGAWTAARAWSRTQLPVAAPLVVTAAYVDRADMVRRGETLTHVFGRQGIAGPELLAVLGAATGLNPRRVAAGQIFEFRYAVGEPAPLRVKTRLSDQRVLWLRRGAGGGWRGDVERVVWTPHQVRVIGTINSSVYQTIHALIPDSVLPPEEKSKLVFNLADEVFAWEIDFAVEIREGDRFRFLVERLVSSEGEVRYGRLLAAHLATRGTERTAYVLSDAAGRNAYYDAGGRSLRRAFKRSPVSYRVTSRFSFGRFHPILRRYRAHLGTDFRAPYGTPVEATGEGTVVRAGRWGGYGLVVAIRHLRGIETRYAHLSRIGNRIQPGVRVDQGEMIGYSGNSGLSAAPHVHYEFLKNGKQINPSPADAGQGAPVPEARREAFEATRYHYDRLLRAASVPVLAIGSS